MNLYKQLNPHEKSPLEFWELSVLEVVGFVHPTRRIVLIKIVDRPKQWARQHNADGP